MPSCSLTDEPSVQVRLTAVTWGSAVYAASAGGTAESAVHHSSSLRTLLHGMGPQAIFCWRTAARIIWPTTHQRKTPPAFRAFTQVISGKYGLGEKALLDGDSLRYHALGTAWLADELPQVQGDGLPRKSVARIVDVGDRAKHSTRAGSWPSHDPLLGPRLSLAPQPGNWHAALGPLAATPASGTRLEPLVGSLGV